MPRVAIVGLGLIGGSLALALGQEREVVGAEPDPANRRLAQEAGLEVHEHAPTAVARADLVVLATPLPALPQVLVAIAEHLSPGATVTDVGGVKAGIVEVGRRHFPDGTFVGGHPMAGSEGRGFGAAHAGIFRGANWALTPETSAEQAAAARIRDILAPAGATFVEMPAAVHDRAVAFTSHVPYLAAVALARAAMSAGREGVPSVEDLIGPGFRDMTRLALTPADLGHAMAFENKEAILLGLGALRYQIAQLEFMVGGRMGREFKALAQGVAEWRSAR